MTMYYYVRFSSGEIICRDHMYSKRELAWWEHNGLGGPCKVVARWRGRGWNVWPGQPDCEGYTEKV